jgi:uncharacterized peroxidase-related enzyme
MTVDRLHSMSTSGHHFLTDPTLTEQGKRLFDEDEADDGFIMNLTRLWAYEPAAIAGLLELMKAAAKTGGLSLRQRGVLVSASASTLGDAYCSLAWGARLASETDPSIAAGVLRGDDSGLDPPDQAMAVWARKVVADPTGTEESDVARLRAVGFTDTEIFAMTVFIALRLAFSTVNNALGARPDLELAETVPPEVAAAVDYGRPVAPAPSGHT